MNRKNGAKFSSAHLTLGTFWGGHAFVHMINHRSFVIDRAENENHSFSVDTESFEVRFDLPDQDNWQQILWLITIFVVDNNFCGNTISSFIILISLDHF